MKDWTKYIEEQADFHGVTFEEAIAVFEIMGENEAYDGFIIALEDLAMLKEADL